MKRFLTILFVLCCSVTFGQCTYKATAVYCADGDTFDASVHLGLKTDRTIRIRLAYINAPEMKSKDSVKARMAKAYLETLILNKSIYFDTKEKVDKYGRYIKDVFLTDQPHVVSVSNLMVAAGMAKQVKY